MAEDKKRVEEETKVQDAPAAEGAPGVETGSGCGDNAGERAETAAAETAAAEADAAEADAAEVKPSEPDWKDRYARLMADFDNFKKRTARDREDTFRYAEADILKDVLPTVDNLALALDKAANRDDAFVKGVQLVYDSLLGSLKTHGAEPFDSIGSSLDTEKMEAIATMPSAEVEEGRVSAEVKRGWMLKGKVLRVAQVVVSSGKPEVAEAARKSE